MPASRVDQNPARTALEDHPPLIRRQHREQRELDLARRLVEKLGVVECLDLVELRQLGHPAKLLLALERIAVVGPQLPPVAGVIPQHPSPQEVERVVALRAADLGVPFDHLGFAAPERLGRLPAELGDVLSQQLLLALGDGDFDAVLLARLA